MQQQQQQNTGPEPIPPQVPSQYGTRAQILEKVTATAARANNENLPMTNKAAVYCDTLETTQSAVGDLMSCEEVGIYCEGNMMPGRDGGSISLICVTDPDHNVYLFDIHKMVVLGGMDPFTKGGLRLLLEGDDVLKVVFDARCDNDILQHTYGFRMNNCFDLQVLYTLNFSYELALEAEKKAMGCFYTTTSPGVTQQTNPQTGAIVFIAPNGEEVVDIEENPRFLKGFQHYLDLSAVVPNENEILDAIEDIQERGRTAFGTGAEEGEMTSKVWDIRPLPQ